MSGDLYRLIPEEGKHLAEAHDTKGAYRGVYLDEREIPLHRKIPVKIVNMSASGILLSADMGYFNIGEVFSLALRTPQGALTLRCEIVRIQKSYGGKRKGVLDGALQEEYGCRIREAHFEKGKGQE